MKIHLIIFVVIQTVKQKPPMLVTLTVFGKRPDNLATGFGSVCHELPTQKKL